MEEGGVRWERVRGERRGEEERLRGLCTRPIIALHLHSEHLYSYFNSVKLWSDKCTAKCPVLLHSLCWRMQVSLLSRHTVCPYLTTSSLSSRDTSDCSSSMTHCDCTPRFCTAWHASALRTSLRSNRMHQSRRSRTPSWSWSSKPRPARNEWEHHMMNDSSICTYVQSPTISKQ